MKYSCGQEKHNQKTGIGQESDQEDSFCIKDDSSSFFINKYSQQSQVFSGQFKSVANHNSENQQSRHKLSSDQNRNEIEKNKNKKPKSFQQRSELRTKNKQKSIKRAAKKYGKRLDNGNNVAKQSSNYLRKQIKKKQMGKNILDKLKNYRSSRIYLPLMHLTAKKIYDLKKYKDQLNRFRQSQSQRIHNAIKACGGSSSSVGVSPEEIAKRNKIIQICLKSIKASLYFEFGYQKNAVLEFSGRDENHQHFIDSWQTYKEIKVDLKDHSPITEQLTIPPMTMKEIQEHFDRLIDFPTQQAETRSPSDENLFDVMNFGQHKS